MHYAMRRSDKSARINRARGWQTRRNTLIGPLSIIHPHKEINLIPKLSLIFLFRFGDDSTELEDYQPALIRNMVVTSA